MKVNSIREYEVPGTYAFENELLGTLIDNPSFIVEARKSLDSSSFADLNNKKVWEVLCDLDSTGKEVNALAIFPATSTQHFQNNILPHCTGAESATDIFRKIDTLWMAAAKRDAYFASVNLLQLASGVGDVKDIYNIMHNYTEKINAATRNDDTQKIADAVNEYGEILQKRELDRASGKRLRVPTSFHTLDFLTYNGFANGNLIILAARPSVGKTGVMLQMARAAALDGFNALVFSLEMTNPELVQRMLTAVAGIEPFDLANGRVDWNDFDEATGKFSDLPLWLNDKAGSLDEILSKITTATRQGHCDIAFIDYLGLISYRDSGKTLYQQVTDCTKRLKRLAKDCGIPIVLLCQLNRDMCKEGRAPQLHDLRDSGSIEQDADIVLMLDRQLTEDNTERVVRMFVRKNRQGRVGDCIRLEADQHFTCFEDKGDNSQY